MLNVSSEMSVPSPCLLDQDGKQVVDLRAGVIDLVLVTQRLKDRGLVAACGDAK